MATMHQAGGRQTCKSMCEIYAHQNCMCEFMRTKTVFANLFAPVTANLFAEDKPKKNC